MEDIISAPKISLFATAKSITRFLFRQTELPTQISFYRGLFVGLFAGLSTAAAGAPALYAYIERYQHDPSKIQLVVYHIVRLFEQRPDYRKLAANPRMLLVQMEPEVMRMVNRHLSKTEADKVMEELKRKFNCDETEEKARKRIVVRHPEENLLILAPMPGTFPPTNPETPKKKKNSPTASPTFRRSSAPSPEPDPRSQHAPKSVSYGLDYHDQDLYTSPFSSPSSSSREPSPSPPTKITAEEAATTTAATKPAPKKSILKKGRGRGRTGGVPYAQNIWKKATLSPSDKSKLPPPVNRGPAYAQKRILEEADRQRKRRRGPPR